MHSAVTSPSPPPLVLTSSLPPLTVGLSWTSCWDHRPLVVREEVALGHGMSSRYYHTVTIPPAHSHYHTVTIPPAQVRVDSIVGGECIYCGDLMIQSIEMPFIPGEQFTSALESWK